jgi:hypothetical protein
MPAKKNEGPGQSRWHRFSATVGTTVTALMACRLGDREITMSVSASDPDVVANKARHAASALMSGWHGLAAMAKLKRRRIEREN